MNMVKVKTADLIGYALDWAVGVACKDSEPNLYQDERGFWLLGPFGKPWNPSADWSQSGPLIDNYSISIRSELKDRKYAELWIDRGEDVDYGCGAGPTHLIAVCRAVVSAKLAGLGDLVEVPAELVEVSQ